MTDSTLNRFLARGTNAQRTAFTPDPPTPASGPSNTYFWHETDTGDTFAWNGSSWNQVNGGIPDGDKGDITVSSGTWTVDNGAISYAKMQDVSATSRLLGRVTAGAGDVEEVVLDADTALTANSDSRVATQKATKAYVDAAVSGGGGITALTGDVTATGPGSVAATIANDAVTYAKLQNVSATSRILGRKTAAAGDVEECTLSEILDFIGSAAQGDILYRGASGWARLGAGTAGQVLQTGGAGANPSWADRVRTIAFFFTTTPTSSEVLLLYTAAESITLADDFAGSVGDVGTNPTASFALDVQKNGVSVGTITISTGGAFTFVTSGSSVALVAGDQLKVVAPGSADATVANVSITFKGTL